MKKEETTKKEMLDILYRLRADLICLVPRFEAQNKKALDYAIKALESQRNLTNEQIYQGFIELEAENERLHEALESQPRWVPISERLPEEDQRVIVTSEFGNVGLSLYWKKSYFWNNNYVIAWMPLPEPYKENEENDK